MGQHIIFDFDGTITEEDTIGNIARAALEWRKTSEGGGADLSRDWQSIVESYTQDLAAYDHTQPPEQQRTTWQHERDYLRGRNVVEAASLARVRELGIFASFADHDRLVEAGRRDRETGRTQVRGGFVEYLAMVRARNYSVHVVSVNWSADYIRGVLEPWDITSIIANEIQLDGSIAAIPDCLSTSLSNVEPRKALATSADKLGATRHLLQRVGGQCVGYFGDSTTDLECLHFHGGWVITSDGGGSLARTLRRLGYNVPCVSEPQGANSDISWAHDFAEVAAHITTGRIL
ncbi:hypothetical protein N0V82_005795 [Gnomoniopsis sp. IMI 355080]|nr:hypothetical protein N0V82_005795 [Gnomoniopsis sp. IMI 355080]